MNFKIGVDGGGTKTECILVDASGKIVARRLAPGCNPSIAGAEQARLIVTDALCALRDGATVSSTRLFMAGAPGFWQEFAATLTDFGRTSAHDDSLPVLELATDGAPGLVLHAGTGSFVAARAPDNSVHYAGGIGWRFGDSGSGYELGRRTVARGLLELQGWDTHTNQGLGQNGRMAQTLPQISPALRQQVRAQRDRRRARSCRAPARDRGRCDGARARG